VTAAVPQGAPGVQAALALRALVGSGCCLIMHAHGPDPATALESAGTAVWHVGLAPESATSTDMSPDLVVIDLRGIGDEMGSATLVAMLSQFADVAQSPRFALVVDSREETASAGTLTQWTRTLAANDYFRTFGHSLDVMPADVALFERAEGSVEDVVGRYEEALAAFTDNALTRTEAGESIAARHRLLIDTDRLQGLMARTIRLQDEADYWRLKFEHAGVPSTEIRKVASREAVEQAVARVKASRQYRIGTAVLTPLNAGRRLARRARRGG